MPTIYKCPGCGAAMEFDSTTQKLGCPSCGMQIDVREYEEKYSQNSTQGEYDKEMKMYHCNTCGAELVADEYTSATFCSFCGNPTLVEDLSLIHISEPTRRTPISYAVFCLKKKKKNKYNLNHGRKHYTKT